MHIDNLVDLVTHINWFAAIGTGTDSVKEVPNLEAAVEHWKSERFEEARAVAWEAIRKELIADEALKTRWVDTFRWVHDCVVSALLASETARAFIAKVDQDLEDFATQLPFVGAAGELLLADQYSCYRFNLEQIPYYVEGYWVCGWAGSLSEDVFIYPSCTFLIY